MIIRNNIPGINATRNKGIAQGKLAKNLEKLSSGYRINRAGDDAAGLAISELMRNQIRGLDQSMRNCNDGIGFTNTGDGALAEVHSMLSRLKTLAVQSANGTYTTQARLTLDAERQQLLDELDRIGETAHFAGIQLFGHDDAPKGRPFRRLWQMTTWFSKSALRRKRRWRWNGIMWAVRTSTWTRPVLQR